MLLERADVGNNLPDLLIGQNALPRNHGSAFNAGGNAPEQVIIPNLRGKVGQILGGRIQSRTGRPIPMSLGTMAGLAIDLEHIRPFRRRIRAERVGLAGTTPTTPQT
jgi:hypothetical protein